MRIYELEARFDARKSFYRKAHVIDYENGILELQSYNTIVSRCVNFSKSISYDWVDRLMSTIVPTPKILCSTLSPTS